MLSYDQALDQVLNEIRPLAPRLLPLEEAAGLVLASPAKACWDMPTGNNSAMDGFAIDGNPVHNEQAMAIVGSSYAGHPYAGRVGLGQAVRITTGGQLPDGTDTVIPIEDCVESEGKILLPTVPRQGQHVRYQGEEYRQAEVLASPRTPLRAGDIALLASAGVSHVEVFPKPRIALMTTGDELVELGQQPGPGQIINSNLYFLKARLQECGYTPVYLGIGTDNSSNLNQVFDRALDVDLIVSTGGVSVGEKDCIKTVLESRGFRKIFWKVAIKPGKPVLFGFLDETPYFGLPGNPAATAATFELFVQPALARLSGRASCSPDKRTATLTAEVTTGGKRQAFLWCRLQWQDAGYVVTVSPRQGSGQFRSLQSANALLPWPVGVERLQQGEQVEVLPLF